MARRGSTRRVVGGVAAAAIAALTLGGCVTAFVPSGPAPESEPTGERAPGSLSQVYGNPVTWTACESGPAAAAGLDCGTVSVPADWDGALAGETVAETVPIAIVRLPATGASQGSLLVNPGGPGASGVDFVATAGEQVFSERLRGGFDIIGFDPRGVGASQPVTCLDAAEMDDYLYDVPADPTGSAGWEEEVEGAAAEFARACERNSEIDLNEVSTVSAAHDLDVLRAVLGDEQLHYLGFSYGTFLGATYAELYPERAGRLVLDGAIDPSTAAGEVAATQVRGFEASLRAFLEDCLTGEACPFSGSVDDAAAEVGALLDRVDESPLLAEDGRELGSSTLMTAIITPLYAQASWPVLAQMLGEVRAGVPDTALALADQYNGRSAGGGYTNNTINAFTAYNCRDYPPTSPEDDERILERLEEEAPIFGRYLGGGGDGCAAWPVDERGERGEIVAAGSPPIVVVGTTGDPATPYEWSEALAAQLEAGTLVTYEGEGHTAYGSSNECIERAVDDFLLDGTVPQASLVC